MKIKLATTKTSGDPQPITRDDLDSLLNFHSNKSQYAIDEGRLETLLGVTLASDAEVLIDPTTATCSVGKFVIPLERVTKLALSMEDGMAFPADAFAEVGDATDPSTWAVRLWETPQLGVTAKQLTLALKAAKKRPKKSPCPSGTCDQSTEMDAEDMEMSQSTMKRFIEAWKAVYGDVPLPPVLRPMNDDVSVEKPGIEETDKSFRFRLREPGQFRIMRTISITDGIQAVVGKRGPNAPMQLQSLIFSKSKFPTKDAVSKYLRAHPDLKKRTFNTDQRQSAASRGQAMPDGSFPIQNTQDLKNAIRAIGRAKNPSAAKAHIRRRARSLGATDLLPDTWKHAETPGEELAVAWEEHGYRQLSVTGEELPAVLHAHFKNVPLKRLETATLDDLIAEEWTATWTLRMGKPNGQTGFWGFVLDGGERLQPEAVACASLVSGPSQLLAMTDESRIVPYDGKDEGSKIFTVRSGTYVPAFAAADRFVFKFSWLDHLVEFLGSGESLWVARFTDAQLPTLDTLLSDLNDGGVGWLLWPKDKRGGGKGFHIVDVAKTVRKRFEYRVCKSTPDQRYTLGIAYPANRTTGDAHGDYVTADQLERTAWDYMLHSRSVGLMHVPGTDGSGAAVESYIYRGPDWQIGEGKVVKAGDWLMGVIWEESAWSKVKSKAIRGFSLQGWARRGNGV